MVLEYVSKVVWWSRIVWSRLAAVSLAVGAAPAGDSRKRRADSDTVPETPRRSRQQCRMKDTENSTARAARCVRPSHILSSGT